MASKQYEIEEIKKICPGYRGKPENFDPTKVGKKDKAPKGIPKRVGPSSAEVPKQSFRTNCSKLTDLAKETFARYEADTEDLSRVIVKEEFNYYATGLLWMRIIDLKSKQGLVSLTSSEKDIRNEVVDKEFHNRCMRI